MTEVRSLEYVLEDELLLSSLAILGRALTMCRLLLRLVDYEQLTAMQLSPELP